MIFRGHSTGEPAQSSVTTSRVTNFISWADTGTSINTGKTRERFEKKMKVNGPRWISLRKKSLAVGEVWMAIFLPTPGFKGKSFELLVLSR